MSLILDLPPAPSVTAAVEVLQDALDSVASLVAGGQLEQLSDSELLAVTAQLQGIASQTRALAVAAAAAVRDGEVATGEGFASTTRWLEASAGLSKSQSRATVALGERLQDEFAATGAAWLAGEIGEGAVQAITGLIPRKLRGLSAVDYEAMRTDLEAMALHHAKTRTVSEVRRAIERAAVVADPVGAEAAAVVGLESEFLSFTPVEDGVEVRGFLSWETAGVVLPAFDQCHDGMYRSGQLAEDYSDHVDRLTSRSPSLRRQHRNAEIFAELATRLLDEGELGTKHAQRPHLTVTVHADDFAAGLGGDILLPGFGPVSVPNTTIERFLCDSEVHPVLTRRSGAPSGSLPVGSVSGVLLEDVRPPEPQYPGSVPGSSDPPWRPPLRPRDGGRGGWEYEFPPAPAPAAAEIAADTDLAAITEFGTDLDDRVSWWNRFLGEPGRHVLDVGRSWRTAPPKIRRALTIRDGGCAVPGCDVDASRCEAHHITYWEHHGATSISNMVLLCAKHHHMVHEGRWRILRNTDLDPGHPDYITLVVPSPERRAQQRKNRHSGSHG